MSAFHGLLVAAGALAFGYLIASTLLGRSRDSGVLAWALALPCLVGYALILMLGHMATGGWLFSHGWFIRMLTALIAAVLLVILTVALVTAKIGPGRQLRASGERGTPGGAARTARGATRGTAR